MRPAVFDLQFDTSNVGEMDRHAVTEDEVWQVLDGSPVFLPNKKAHAATLLMVGPTLGGRFVIVPLAPMAERGLWRPVTAWTSSGGEVTRYYANGGS